MLPAINSDSDSARSKGERPEETNKQIKRIILNINIYVYMLILARFVVVIARV